MKWFNKFYWFCKMTISMINIKSRLKGLSLDEIEKVKQWRLEEFSDEEIISYLKIKRFDNDKNELVKLLIELGFSEGQINDILPKYISSLKSRKQIDDLLKEIKSIYVPKFKI